MEELATLQASVERLRTLVCEASLTAAPDAPGYRLVRFVVSGDGFEATTPTGGDGPAFAVRYDASYFTGIDASAGRFLMGLGTEATLRWLDWFQGDTVTVRVLGDADAGVAAAVEIDDGTDTVAVDPLPSEVVDPDLSTGRPGGFADGRFAPGGDPAPTRVETDGATLERVADAADIVGDDGFPVTVTDGEFRLAVAGDEMRGRGRLAATVSGPDCENRYGRGLAALARVLAGPVTLQVVPGGPLAVVQESEHARRRYVLRQAM